MSSEEAERGGRYSVSIKGNLSNQLMVNVVFKALNLSVCAILTNDAESSCCKTVLDVPGCKTFSSLTSTALIFWGVTIFVFYETSGQFVAEKKKVFFRTSQDDFKTCVWEHSWMFLRRQQDIFQLKIQYLCRNQVFLTRSQANCLNQKSVYFWPDFRTMSSHVFANKKNDILNEALGQFVAENCVFFLFIFTKCFPA